LQGEIFIAGDVQNGTVNRELADLLIEKAIPYARSRYIPAFTQAAFFDVLFVFLFTVSGLLHRQP